MGWGKRFQFLQFYSSIADEITGIMDILYNMVKSITTFEVIYSWLIQFTFNIYWLLAVGFTSI